MRTSKFFRVLRNADANGTGGGTATQTPTNTQGGDPASGQPASGSNTTPQFTQEDLNSFISKRLAEQERKLKQTLTEDPTVIKTILEKHGKAGTPEKAQSEIDAKLQEARKAWENEALTPLQRQLEEATKAKDALLRTTLEAKIKSEAALHFNDLYTKVAPNLEADKFGFNPEVGEFCVKNAAGEFAVNGQFKPITVKEYFETLARNPGEYKDFLRTKPQGGPGAQPGAGGAGVRRISRRDSAAMSANIEGIANGSVIVVD